MVKSSLSDGPAVIARVSRSVATANRPLMAPLRPLGLLPLLMLILGFGKADIRLVLGVPLLFDLLLSS